MFKTHFFHKTTFAISLFLSAALMTPHAFAQTFKVATLSPGGSYWVQRFKDGANAISEQTEGRVKFKFYPGGVMGSDTAVLRKMKIGQLQGGAMATGALYSQYPDAAVLGIPFTFESQDEFDHVLNGLREPIKAGAPETGYVITSIMGGGPAYIFTKREAESFDDLKDHKIWVPDNDPQTAKTLDALGLNPVPLGIGDVLTGLQTGLIDTVAASPVVAIALQWHTRVTHLIKVPVLYLSGLVVLNKRDFSKMSAADQEVVATELAKIAKDIHEKNTEDNEKAFAAMVDQGITIVEPKGEAMKSWEAVEKQARELVLGGSTYSANIILQLEELQKEFKAQMATASAK